MSIVGVIATKGGAGKSTIAVHLAIAAAMKRRRPLILDFDTSQNSILVWAKALRKKSRTPAIQKGVLETLEEDIEAARRRYDLIIVDVAAGGGPAVQRIATIAEHILIPVRASVFDLAATRNTVDLLRDSADNTKPEEIACRNALGKAAIVLNATPKKPSAKWRDELEAALGFCGAGGIPIIGALADRAAYGLAIENGQGVTEDGDDEKAVEEIVDLYRGLTVLEADRQLRLKKTRGRK